MDNTAPPGQRPSGSAAQNNQPPPGSQATVPPSPQASAPASNSSPSDKNGWIKYFSAELVIILIVVGVIAFVIFKPFELFKPKYPVPADMNKSKLPNGKVVIATPPASPPLNLVIHLTENGFEPAVSSSSAAVNLTFQNNSQKPVDIEFSGPQKIESETIYPFQGSPERFLTTKGTYKFYVKDSPEKAGEIIIN